ncbi:MAG: hypothetical protein LBC02_05925 [Planctomycetaceae bacterium]|jgi:hypothetical protein|nr:hypothetical protein [Planctomycetaceae bacterium]
MEKTWYIIVDQDDTERETQSVEMAREAFRKGKMVRIIVQETTLFTKHSSILISVVSEME